MLIGGYILGSLLDMDDMSKTTVQFSENTFLLYRSVLIT